MSCNNSCAVLPPPLRPNIWLHTDPASKFHDSIWRDPSVLKFTPVKEWTAGRKGKKRLRHRVADGSFEQVEYVAKDCPGVFGFNRNSGFYPDRWLFEPSINRGNDKQNSEGDEKKGVKPNGWPNVLNTMFAALRLAFYLGFQRVYLLGADFHMQETQPYAFDQAKSAGGVRANNYAFSKMDAMFAALVPKFNAVGFEVYNLNPESALLAFPYKSFDDAYLEAASSFEQSLRCDGWYSHD